MESSLNSFSWRARLASWFAMSLIGIAGIGSWASVASARVEIAFMEFYSPSGRLVQLEPEGRFAHVAISYAGGWMHAHPSRGVEKVSTEELSRLGVIASVLTLDSVPDITETEAARFLGKPYDTNFSWDDERIYCSELVAKLIGLPPEPMHFDPKLWPPKYFKFEGLPGISPDKVYKALLPRASKVVDRGSRVSARPALCKETFAGSFL